MSTSLYSYLWLVATAYLDVLIVRSALPHCRTIVTIVRAAPAEHEQSRPLILYARMAAKHRNESWTATAGRITHGQVKTVAEAVKAFDEPPSIPKRLTRSAT